MTTPNQPAPDGAYVIGGSGTSGGGAYGQQVTDKGAAQLMLGGFTTIAAISNPLDAVGAAMGMFADQLMKLPLEVLRLFEPLIPGDLLGAFNTVSGAVSSIIGFFQTLGPVLASTFQTLIDFIVNALTGGNGFGNPLELLQPLIAGLAGAVGTAMNTANQAADLVRQVMGYVIQIVQGLENIPVLGDIFEGIQAFAFWILGWFGITRQSVTDTNPAVAAANGRIAALESINTVGLEGFSDHFNRAAIGADWATITPHPGLNIQGEQYVISSYRSAGRYTAKTLLTDNFHVQVAIGQLEVGASNLYICCPPSPTNAGVTSGAFLSLEHTVFPFNQGGKDVLKIGWLNTGLNGGTVVATATFDIGNIKVGDVVAIEYYAATNTFFVFVNNNEITGLRWTDTAHHVTHGSGFREVVLMNCDLDNASFPGPGWDDLSAYDIKVA